MVFGPHPRHAPADIHVERGWRDRYGLLQRFLRLFDLTELAMHSGEPSVGVGKIRI